MTTWIAATNLKGPGFTLWHVGVEHRRYTDKTRKLVGEYLLTRCSGRQLGGPWGYSRISNGAAMGYNDCDRCKNCERLLEKDSRAFQRKARGFILERQRRHVITWFSNPEARMRLEAEEAIAAEEGRL